MKELAALKERSPADFVKYNENHYGITIDGFKEIGVLNKIGGRWTASIHSSDLEMNVDAVQGILDKMRELEARPQLEGLIQRLGVAICDAPTSELLELSTKITELVRTIGVSYDSAKREVPGRPSPPEVEAYQVELVWNREFHFVNYGKPHADVKDAIESAKDIQDSGDGARVKKTRVVNQDDKIVWAYGRMLKTPKTKDE